MHSQQQVQPSRLAIARSSGSAARPRFLNSSTPRLRSSTEQLFYTAALPGLGANPPPWALAFLGLARDPVAARLRRDGRGVRPAPARDRRRPLASIQSIENGREGALGRDRRGGAGRPSLLKCHRRERVPTSAQAQKHGLRTLYEGVSGLACIGSQRHVKCERCLAGMARKCEHPVSWVRPMTEARPDAVLSFAAMRPAR
jgi:hypothetical protein